MANEKPKEKFGFEDYLMMIPLLLSTVLTILGFVVQWSASEETILLIQRLSFYSYAWMCCFGLSVCAREGSHMKCGLFDKLIHNKAPALEKALDLFKEILGFVLTVCLLVWSLQLLQQAVANGTPDAKVAQIPLAAAYLASVVGFALSIFRDAQRFVKSLRKEEVKQ